MNEADCFRRLYRSEFGTDDAFENALFSLCGENLRVYRREGEAVAFSFLLPCLMKSENAVLPAGYIFAAATRPEYRNKGFMTRLLEQMKTEYPVLFLRPASDELIFFYQKVGFAPFSAQAEKELPPVLLPQGSFSRLAGLFPGERESGFPMSVFGIQPPEGLYFPYSYF